MINSNIAVIIPARLGSTRLPGKILADIEGKPMIGRVIEQVLKSDFKNIIVATDDDMIAKVTTDYGAKSIMTDIAHVNGSDRIHEALEIIDPNKKIEYIINVQGDLPLINPDLINYMAELITLSDYDMVTLACILEGEDNINNPSNVKVAFNKKNNRALYFSRSPIPYNASEYYYHIGIYGYKRNSLEKYIKLPESELEQIEKLEQLRFLENDMSIGIKIVDSIPISVDTPADLEKVREMMRRS